MLLDGASAIYGSDAIGGVVNVILKKSFTGTGLVLDGGSTTKGGGTTWHASIMQGFGKPEDKVNGFLALEYRHQDQITLAQRSGEDWSNFDWTGAGRRGSSRPARAAPPSRSRYLLTPYLQRPGAYTTDPANFIFLDNHCNLALRNANQCTFEDTWATDLCPRQQNVNVIGRVAFKFAESWELVLTGSYFESESQQVTRQTNVPAGSFAGNTVIGSTCRAVHLAGNHRYTVPATYPGNTFGMPANVRAIVPVPARVRPISTRDSTRLVAHADRQRARVRLERVGRLYEGRDGRHVQRLHQPVRAVRRVERPDQSVQPVRRQQRRTSWARWCRVTSKKVTSELDFLQFVATRDLMKLEGGPLGWPWAPAGSTRSRTRPIRTRFPERHGDGHSTPPTRPATRPTPTSTSS